MTPHLEINDRCISCDACRLLCPDNAILKIKENYLIEEWACTLCSICIHICPVNCIKLINVDSD
ncbi:MAG: 4Fe-4S binding protein [Halobacteriovoraceae bacterium]|nr:4Fe-4S binding protein [Halobacteriovoraceae bacterium]